MHKTRRVWAGVALVAMAVIAAACSSGSGTTSTSTTLNGSGSSFQDAFNQKAKAEFAKKANGVTVNYTKSGSINSSIARALGRPG